MRRTFGFVSLASPAACVAFSSVPFAVAIERVAGLKAAARDARRNEVRSMGVIVVYLRGRVRRWMVWESLDVVLGVRMRGDA
jgi:hypothetical protein